jgi:hexosaminidase
MKRAQCRTNTATSHETIRAIVQYAKDRGVRVVVEFDTPGHAASWGVGDPSLTVTCPRYSANINNIPLNPAHEHTFDVVQGLFGEMVGLFPDAFFHIGGDEVVFGCWNNNTDVVNWMRRMGFTNGVQVEGYFIDRIQKFLESLNRTTIVWEDLFDEGVTLDSSTIIHVWKDQSVLNQVRKNEIVIAHSNSIYRLSRKDTKD